MEEGRPFSSKERLSRRADGLQSGADLMYLRGRVGPPATLALVFGILLLLTGTAQTGRPEETVNLQLFTVLLGSSFFAEGAWSLIHLMPATVFLGAVNSVALGLIVLLPFNGQFRFGLLTPLGLLFFVTAHLQLLRFFELSRSWKERPSKDEMELLRHVIEGFHSSLEVPPDHRLEFTSPVDETGSWKGDLSRPVAFLYHEKTGRLHCVSPSQFFIFETAVTGLALVRLRGRRFSASIPLEAMRIYDLWRERASAA
jgi:hypothetical protein